MLRSVVELLPPIILSDFYKEHTMTEHSEYSYLDAAGEGASVESAIAGNYDFSISAVLTQAKDNMQGNKGLIWSALAFFVVVSIMFQMISQYFLGASNPTLAMAMHAAPPGVGGVVLQNILNMFISTPLGAGLTMMGIKCAAGAEVRWSEVYAYFDKVLVLVGTTLLMLLMIVIGFLLLIIPGIYLSLAYSFAIPLVLDKGMSPWEALETSRKAVSHHWFKVFGLYLVFGLIVVISVIPLGIGLVWTIPMGLLLKGILYRTIFGYEVQEVNAVTSD